MGNVRLRVRWYSAPGVAMICGVAFCVAFPLAGYGDGLLAGAVVIALAWGISRYLFTIEVTPTELRALVTLLDRRATPRDAIRVMHWHSESFQFADARGALLLRIPSFGWTRSQVLELSEALGVPLYDHRTKRGWGRDVTRGRIVERSTRD